MPRSLLALLLLLPLLGVPVRAEDEPAPAPVSKEDVLERLKDRERSVRLSGIVDAAEVQDSAVTSLLVKCLKDEDYQIRMAALEALRTRAGDGDRRKAAQAVCARLPALARKTADAEEYLNALSVLHDLAHPASIKALVDMPLEEPRESAEARLMAVGNIPCAEAVEALIAFLSKGRRRSFREQRQAAVKALRYATGENLGQDPDRWRAWWKDARPHFDFEAAAAARAEERGKTEEKRRRAEERKARQEERERKRAAGEDEDR